jgi:hypothetical protein
MPTPLGEEWIKIRPDASTFRAELQAQIASAMTGVQAQIAQAQRQMAAVPAATRVTQAGVIIPPGVKSVTQQVTQATEKQAQATKSLGNASKATKSQLAAMSLEQMRNANVTRGMQRNIASAETAVGRYSRGMLAATAASTGFFRAVSFASGAFLVGATIGATIGAAVNEFSKMTTIGQTTVRLIQATGGAANVTAQQVNTLATSTMKLTGVDDELVKQGANVLLTFRAIKNEAGAGNDVFNRATRAAADIATVFRSDVRGAALQLGKALQDPERGVTALRRSGITLTIGQRELIKELVRSGAVLSAQKLILGEVERQVGGAAEAVGRTLPGRLRIMRETALNTLGDYVKRLTESKTAADLAAGAAKGMADAFGAVRTVVAAIGPSLVGIGQGLGRVVSGVGGVGTLLGAAAAYKAVTLSARLATTATGLFAAASAGAAQAALLEARASDTVTLRLERQAAAEMTAGRAAQRTMTTMVALNAVFAAGAFASGQWQLGLFAAGLAIAGLAGKALAAVRALRAAGTAVTAFRVASAALGGPLGIAAIAVTGLAVGLYKIWKSGRDGAGSLKATKAALDGLNESLDETMRLRAAMGTARERVGVAQFDVRAAERTLQRAQERLANTRAAPGSLQYRYLEEQVTAAEQALAKTQRNLAKAQQDLDAAREKNRINQQGEPQRIADITKELQKQIDAQKRAGVPGRAGALLPTNRLPETQKAIDTVIEKYGKLQETEKGASREAAAAIFTITSMLNRLPTEKEVSIIVAQSERGATANQILQRLGIITKDANEAARTRLDTERSINATLREQFLIAQVLLKTERDKFQKIHQEAVKRREALRTARLETEAARDAVESAREGRAAAIESLAEAQRSLGDAQQNLTDTIARAHESVAEAIRSSREALNQSIQDAKANLLDLGQAIADAIAKFTDAGDTGSEKLGARFRRLRDQILRGQGGPETRKAMQEVQFAIQGTTEIDTERITRQFNDLVDAFSRGQITLPQFNRRFTNLLKGVNIDQFRKKFGTAAANTLIEQIKTFRRQAGLIAKSPERAGGAIAQKLVNPLKQLAAGQKAIADARKEAARDIGQAERNLADANRAVAKAQTDIVRSNRQLAAAERRLRQAQHKETIANTRAIAQNTKETKQLRIVIAARKALIEVKPKPKGRATVETIPIEERPR